MFPWSQWETKAEERGSGSESESDVEKEATEVSQDSSTDLLWLGPRRIGEASWALPRLLFENGR